MGPPDYVKQETINRITTNNGTWTADRDGYVSCRVEGGTDTVGYLPNVQIFINGKVAVHESGGSSQGSNRASASATLPVKKGDIVRFNLYVDAAASFQSFCYFIPPAHNTGGIAALVCVSY
jgi:hypothetical protein